MCKTTKEVKNLRGNDIEREENKEGEWFNYILIQKVFLKDELVNNLL